MDAGFGLFAAEDIEENCFIGEYAADIVSGNNCIRIKRPDATMYLIESRSPIKSLTIGPSIRCGYVCLINGCAKDEENCSSIKA